MKGELRPMRRETVHGAHTRTCALWAQVWVCAVTVGVAWAIPASAVSAAADHAGRSGLGFAALADSATGAAVDSATAWADTVVLDFTGIAVDDSAIAAAQEEAARARDEAAIDSLNAYWRDLDTRWYEPLTPQLLAPGPGAAALDSLARAGDRELVALLAGRRWRTTIAPLARLGFNRCEGLRPGFALNARRLARHGARAQLGLSYGIADERIRWDAALSVPLAIATPRGASGRAAGRSWPRLRLEVDGGDRVVAFAGRRDFSEQFEAFLSGPDPSMYHGLRDGGAALAWRPWRDAELSLGARYAEHAPLRVATRWSLLGERADAPDNWAAARLVSRAAVAGARVRAGAFTLAAGAQRHEVDFADPARRDGPLWRLDAGLRAAWLTRQGHEIAVRGEWRRNDRAAPLQWQQWLGGPGSLRGYPVRELAGGEAALASLDLRSGFDLLRALRVPLLGRLRLQPIAFADWGRAERDDGPPPPAGAAGWRADAGFGLGRMIGAPGLGGNLRLYAAKPVLNGQGDRAWQFLLELEP